MLGGGLLDDRVDIQLRSQKPMALFHLMQRVKKAWGKKGRDYNR
jgi:hypothetical protein